MGCGVRGKGSKTLGLWERRNDFGWKNDNLTDGKSRAAKRRKHTICFCYTSLPTLRPPLPIETPELKD